MHSNFRNISLGLVLALSMGAVACNDALSPDTEEGVEEQTMALNFAVPKLGDIHEVKFKIIQEKQTCSGPSDKYGENSNSGDKKKGDSWYDCEIDPIKKKAKVKLRDYPKAFGTFFEETDATTKLGDKSSHYAADQHIPVPPGKYTVKAIPLTKDGKASEFCSKATRKGVKVENSKMTHVELISQCLGKEMGGLNAILAFNRAPSMGIDYKKSNKVGCEGRLVKVCATAKDKDKDKLKMVWKKDGEVIAKNGQKVHKSPITKMKAPKMEYTKKYSKLKECIVYQPKTKKKGGETQKFSVKAYDLDGKKGKIEELLKKYSKKDKTSHVKKEFPIEAHRCKGKVLTIGADLSNHNDVSTSGNGPFAAGDEPSFPILMKFLQRTINHLADQQAAFADADDATRKENLKILVVLNSQNQGEYVDDNPGMPNDPNYVEARLQDAGYENVHFHDEDVDGRIKYRKMQNYNVVWMSNPGYPLNLTVAKYNALHEYATSKKGSLVLQGDDITQVSLGESTARNEAMTKVLEALTGLQFDAHGTSCGGYATDNNDGLFYGVFPTSLLNPFRSYVYEDLELRNLLYGNDIDRVTVLDPNRTDVWAHTVQQLFERVGVDDYEQAGTCADAADNPVIVDHNLWSGSL